MATTSTTPAASEQAPPYLPFTTFQSAVDNLRTHGLPDPIDRTTWDSRSGTDQVQIIGALKFLGLIGEGDHPTQALRTLTDAPPNTQAEKAILTQLVRTHYAKVFEELDIKVATPGQLEDAIASYGVTGATRDRAVRFFLKAASHCGIELSSRLTRNLRSRTSITASNGTTDENAAATEGATPPAAPPRQRRRRRNSTAPSTPPGKDVPVGNAMKTISLPNVGGSLTISGTFNAFGLSGEERTLVYEIIDKMNEFEKKASE